MPKSSKMTNNTASPPSENRWVEDWASASHVEKPPTKKKSDKPTV